MTSPAYDIHDTTTVLSADDIDWSLFDPERLDHVHRILDHGIAQGMCTPSIVAGWLGTYGRKDIISVNRRSSSRPPVDMRDALSARARWLASKAQADADQAGFVAALRQTYRDGATASALARALDLSVARVNQLVAGARADQG